MQWNSAPANLWDLWLEPAGLVDRPGVDGPQPVTTLLIEAQSREVVVAGDRGRN